MFLLIASCLMGEDIELSDHKLQNPMTKPIVERVHWTEVTVPDRYVDTSGYSDVHCFALFSNVNGEGWSDTITAPTCVYTPHVYNPNPFAKGY